MLEKTEGAGLTLLVCPLCGRSVGLQHFDPGSFDRDIYVREVRGLGRGQGFEEVGRSSALHDLSVISKVKPRLFDLVSLLLSSGNLSREELSSNFGMVPQSDEAETGKLRVRLERAERDLGNLEDEVNSVADDLADAASVDVDVDLSPIERLQTAANSLKDECNAPSGEPESVADLERIAESMAAEIYDSLDFDRSEIDEDEPIEARLRKAVRMLISDYLDLREATESG